MKRIVFALFIIFLLLSTVSCKGNFAQMDLNEPILIPENGVIEKSVFEKVKYDNAIATFIGNSNNIEYKWIIFGRDIRDAHNVNLLVDMEMTEKGISLEFAGNEKWGFSALLSVCLNEKWSFDGAEAYCGEELLCPVSVTGSKTSILNIPIDRIVENVVIIPTETESMQEKAGDSLVPDDSMPESDKSVTNTQETTDVESTGSQNSETPIPDTSDSDDRLVSDGKETGQDQFKTDPVPQGKPLPVEPEDQEVDKKKTYTCTFSIECSTILNNISDLDPDKRELIPSNGIILAPTTVTFYEGESVFDVLQRVCKENGIHLESSWTPIYNSAYIEGIHNLYEFDCGSLSGWMYRVDGWYPNYGCSRYQLADGEVVEWRYTCDLGKDIGEVRLG